MSLNKQTSISRILANLLFVSLPLGLLLSINLYGCAVTTGATEGTSETIPNTVEASTKLTSSTSPSSSKSDAAPQSTAREGNADLVAANQFTESNLEKLREDAAVGEGDYLDSLGLLLGVPRARLNDFGHLAKERYAELFSRGDSSSQQIVMSLNEAVRRYPWFRN